MAEASNPCDIQIVHRYKWETMTFNVFEMGSDGGVVLEPIHRLPWSNCCATVIDRFGVCWWISI